MEEGVEVDYKPLKQSGLGLKSEGRSGGLVAGGNSGRAKIAIERGGRGVQHQAAIAASVKVPLNLPLNAR